MARVRKSNWVKNFHSLGFNKLLLALLITTVLLYAGSITLSGVLAKFGNSFDAGKWGKKADATKLQMSLEPTPSPTLSKEEDSLPPDITINYPIDGSTHSTYLIGIRATVHDNIGISHATFYINGELKFVDYEPEDIYDLYELGYPYVVEEPEYSFDWTIPQSGTTYDIVVEAVDLAGNSSTDSVQISSHERANQKGRR